MTDTSTRPDGKAVTHKKTFSRETTVSISVKANPSILWALLTHASDYPRWNTTIVSLHGTMAAGETIHLISTLDPQRTFRLKVKEAISEQRLVWGDTMGSRVYTITATGTDMADFTMTERIGGPLFPLFAGMIPSFDAAFEQFAMDLKKEAEYIQHSKN